MAQLGEVSLATNRYWRSRRLECSDESALAALLADIKRWWYSTALQEHVLSALPRFVEYLGKQRVVDLRVVSEPRVTAYARHLAEAEEYERHALRALDAALAARLHQALHCLLVKEGVLSTY
jgi:hypothetical protein